MHRNFGVKSVMSSSSTPCRSNAAGLVGKAASPRSSHPVLSTAEQAVPQTSRAFSTSSTARQASQYGPLSHLKMPDGLACLRIQADEAEATTRRKACVPRAAPSLAPGRYGPHYRASRQIRQPSARAEHNPPVLTVSANGFADSGPGCPSRSAGVEVAPAPPQNSSD